MTDTVSAGGPRPSHGLVFTGGQVHCGKVGLGIAVDVVTEDKVIHVLQRCFHVAIVARLARRAP
ncbi:hypothetical protein HC341_13680 [Aquisalimonas sp. 2447]|uniref:hypothetical protein n=1 Tax=Aquisalimonas sp. 2447 TaxID=2740807 RepID=UPI001432406E|nr:hypothetical protein [Aquisalimonas sp. 2447]QIT56151.1 hypothetical protein HC341_13680 [Aquisalimonas sp. 2447]